MPLKTTLFSHTYIFDSIKELIAKAGELKSGDTLAGLAAESNAERAAAKIVLADVTLETLYNNPAVPYEEDEVTRVIIDAVDEAAFQRIKRWSVGELREFLLESSENEIKAINQGLTAEMISAVTRLMSNLDLVYAARKLENRALCNTEIGRRGTLASRLQPNHPTDDIDGIMASLMEGMSYGVGDAVIGLNPVTDSADKVERVISRFHQFKEKWDIPTQNCILAHVTTQMRSLEHGAPLDLMFQSIAGSQVSNAAFGINIALLDEANAMMAEKKSSSGPNYMYFETGEGSELSSEGYFGTDQLTMEARCYGLAKRYSPFLENSVVGFIGPEYLYDGKQVTRAGLEDHFMGKLTGLPMGVDVCYTNHVKADQNDLEGLALLLANSGCSYFMGVPAGDDVMLMYQSTSFHDIAALREITGTHAIPEFERRMEELGILSNGRLAQNAGNAAMFL